MHNTTMKSVKTHFATSRLQYIWKRHGNEQHGNGKRDQKSKGAQGNISQKTSRMMLTGLYMVVATLGTNVIRTNMVRTYSINYKFPLVITASHSAETTKSSKVLPLPVQSSAVTFQWNTRSHWSWTTTNKFLLFATKMRYSEQRGGFCLNENHQVSDRRTIAMRK